MLLTAPGVPAISNHWNMWMNRLAFTCDILYQLVVEVEIRQREIMMANSIFLPMSCHRGDPSGMSSTHMRLNSRFAELHISGEEQGHQDMERSRGEVDRHSTKSPTSLNATIARYSARSSLHDVSLFY